MDAGPTLPAWEEQTVAVLTTVAADGAPHAIPVSTALRAGSRTIYLALALRRGSLARLRAEPRVALTVLAAGVATTARAHATVVEEPLAESSRVVAVRLDVDAVSDHLTERLELLHAARARWVDAEAAANDEAVRAGLRRLVSEAPASD